MTARLEREDFMVLAYRLEGRQRTLSGSPDVEKLVPAGA
jgi:hypothetical protein